MTDKNYEDKKRVLLGLCKLKQKDENAFSLVREPHLSGYPFPSSLDEAFEAGQKAPRYWLYTDSEKVLALMRTRYENSSSPSKSKSLTVIESERPDASPKYKVEFHGELIHALSEQNERTNPLSEEQESYIGVDLTDSHAAKALGITSLTLNDFAPEDRMIGEHTILPTLSKANGKSDRFRFALCPVQEREGMHYALIARMDYADKNKYTSQHEGNAFEAHSSALFPSMLNELREGQTDPQHRALTTRFIDFQEGYHPDGMGKIGVTYIPDYIVAALKNTYGDSLTTLKDVINEAGCPDDIEHDPLAKQALDTLYAEDIDEPLALHEVAALCRIALAPKNPREVLPEYKRIIPKESAEDKLRVKHITEYAERLNAADFYIERRQTLSGEPKEFLVAENADYLRKNDPTLIHDITSDSYCYTGDIGIKEKGARGSALSLQRDNPRDQDSPNYYKFTTISSAADLAHSNLVSTLLDAGVHVRGVKREAGEITQTSEGEYVPFRLNYHGFKRHHISQEIGARMETPTTKAGKPLPPVAHGTVETEKLYLQPYEDRHGVKHYAAYAVIKAMDGNSPLKYQTPYPTPPKGQKPVASFEAQLSGRIMTALSMLNLNKNDVDYTRITRPENNPIVVRIDLDDAVYHDIVQQLEAPESTYNDKTLSEVQDRMRVRPEKAIASQEELAELDQYFVETLANSRAYDLFPKKTELEIQKPVPKKREKGPSPDDKPAGPELHRFNCSKESALSFISQFEQFQENADAKKSTYPSVCIGTRVLPPKGAQRLQRISQSELDELPDGKYDIIKKHDTTAGKAGERTTSRERKRVQRSGAHPKGNKGKSRSVKAAEQFVYDIEEYTIPPQMEGVLWLRTITKDPFPEKRARFDTEFTQTLEKENKHTGNATEIETAGIYSNPIKVKTADGWLLGYPIPSEIYNELAEEFQDQEHFVTGPDYLANEDTTDQTIDLDWSERYEFDDQKTVERKIKSHFSDLEKSQRDQENRVTKEKSIGALSKLAGSGKARIALIGFDKDALSKQTQSTQEEVDGLKQIVSLKQKLNGKLEKATPQTPQLPGQSNIDKDYELKLRQSSLSATDLLHQREAQLELQTQYSKMLKAESENPVAYIIHNPSVRDVELLDALYSEYNMLHIPIQRIDGAYKNEKDGNESHPVYVLYPKPALSKIFGDKPVSPRADAPQKEGAYLRPLRQPNAQTSRSKKEAGDSDKTGVETPIKHTQLTRYTHFAFTPYKRETKRSGKEALALSSKDKDTLSRLSDLHKSTLFTATRLVAEDATKLQMRVGSHPCLLFRNDPSDKSLRRTISDVYDTLSRNSALNPPYALGDVEEHLIWDMVPRDAAIPQQRAIAAMMDLLTEANETEKTLKFFENDLGVGRSIEREMRESIGEMGERFSNWGNALEMLQSYAARGGLLGRELALSQADEETIEQTKALLENSGLADLIRDYELTDFAKWNAISQWSMEDKQEFANDFLGLLRNAKSDEELIDRKLSSGEIGDDISDQDIADSIDVLREAEDDKVRDMMSSTLESRSYNDFKKLRYALEDIQGKTVTRNSVTQEHAAIFGIKKDGSFEKIDTKHLSGNRSPLNSSDISTVAIFCDRNMPQEVKTCLTEQMQDQRRSLQKSLDGFQGDASVKREIAAPINGAIARDRTEQFTQRSGSLAKDLYERAEAFRGATAKLYGETNIGKSQVVARRA